MVVEKSKPSSVSSKRSTPRTLDVRKFAEYRAPELESLHAVISDRLSGDFQIKRSKRRRTTGHRTPKNRWRKRPKVDGEGGGEGLEGLGLEKEREKVSRRVRRRIELRRNPESGFVVTGDGTKRLRTHLWHAKRFNMVKQWGFYLPLGLHGRGRGSRAVLKWLKSGAVVHDSSYHQAIQLEGPEDSLLDILRMVLLPSPKAYSEDSLKPVICGGCFEVAMLYHVGTHLSQLIAPVRYMWRPMSKDDGHSSADIDHVSDRCKIPDKLECSSSRQLWVWIHAAALQEGFDALRSACQKQMDANGTSVTCFSLEGHIAKLEVAGSRASQILQKILHPISVSGSDSSKSSSLAACTNSELQKTSLLDHVERIPPGAILSLTVHDPRNLPCEKIEAEPKAPSRLDINFHDEDVRSSRAAGSSAANEATFLSPWSEPKTNWGVVSDCKELWDSSIKLKPPIEEGLLCAEKHLRRLKLFYLDYTNQGKLLADAVDTSDRHCSLLILVHGNQGNFGARLSIILSLSWVKPFWMSLVSNGAHAIGLRERRCIACDSGLPCFPYDFPDCKAYSALMADEAAAFEREVELRPLAMRPLRLPISPPWDCVLSTMKEGSGIVGDCNRPHQQLVVAEVAAASSTVNLENVESSSCDQIGASCEGLMLRTSKSLRLYLEKKLDMGLLLFPHLATWERGLSELVEENKRNWMARCAHLRPVDEELCFVRIVLHAYKEGVFEEGAVICAPSLTDLSLWASRSEQGIPQIPGQLIGSYFYECASGKWELRIPKDKSAQQSFRWPIGFVTSGFVRGSKKPVAVAYCEAKLLGLLRRQQSSQVENEKAGIFVLVRNMRSTTYRRAVATIVLEQQENDTDFI